MKHLKTLSKVTKAETDDQGILKGLIETVKELLFPTT